MRDNEGKRRGMMKKIVLMGAMALFLSGMAAQAQSTISWDFDTVGDAEGWVTVPDGLNSLSNGIVVANGYDSVVLTAPDVTGDDPGISITTNLPVVSGEFWDTVEIRMRTLDGNGGTPIPYEPVGTVMVLNHGTTGQIVSNPIGDLEIGWTNTVEAGEWFVTTRDISEVGTNNITSLRVDPPALSSRNFEFDYIRLHTSTNAPPPPGYKTDWEFNTPGDLEGWDDSTATITDPLIADAIGGDPESVLTAGTPDVFDPYVVNSIEPANLEPGHYWSNVVLRIRLHDGSVPVAWGDNYAELRLNGGAPSEIGGLGWEVTPDGDEWIIANGNLSFLGAADIYSMRLDPFNESAGNNFELDYIRFETSTTPPVPPVFDFEFNTPGDTEGWTGDQLTGIAVAPAVSGSEVVLTCADITGADSKTAWAGVRSPASRYWESVELRWRLLDGNGGSPISHGVGDIMQINNVYPPIYPMGTASWDTTLEANGWITTLYDISFLGAGDLTALRFDYTGDPSENFEVDYIRFHLRDTPAIPYATRVVKGWEFNTPGDTEDITTPASPQEITGLTAATDISSVEGVLTSSDITGLNPQLHYNFSQGASLAITPSGPWTTLEMRIRTLDGNPGDPGVSSTNYLADGTFFWVGGLGEILLIETDLQSDNWQLMTYDISGLGSSDFVIFQLEPVGNNTNINFEIDYIRLNEQLNPYDTWADSYSLSGADALDTADPDEDTYNNLYEYGFGGDPTNAADSGYSTGGAAAEGGTNYLEYIYARRHGFKQGVDYSIKLKDDLVFGSWINIGAMAEVGSFEFNAAYEVVTNRIETVDSQKFITVEVTGE